MKRKPARGFGRSTPKTPDQDDLIKILEQAIRYWQEGKLAQAEDICKQVLAKLPNQPDALYLMGLIYYRIGMKDKAIEWLQKTLEVVPDSIDVYNSLGLIYKDTRQWDQATDLYRKALEIDPNHALSYYHLGLCWQEQGKLEAAKAIYQQAITHDPQLTQAYNNLGTVKRALGDPQGAEATYRQALAIQADAKTYNNLGNAVKAQGRWQEALQHYTTAIELDPYYPFSYNNLATAEVELGRYDDAINHYRQALELSPQYAEAHSNLGTVLAKTDQLNEAKIHIHQAIRLKPNQFRFHINLSDVLLAQKDPTAALHATETCLKLHPGNAFALAYQAVAYYQLSDPALDTLYNYDQLIREIDCPLEDPYKTELITYIQNHPRLTWEKLPNTTRAGYQTPNMASDPSEIISQLKQIIKTQIQAQRATYSSDPDHPYLAHLPQTLHIKDLWAVILPPHGHQIPHIHPSAQLCGVMYLQVPTMTRDASADQSGWIEFGRPVERFQTDLEPKIKRIQPRDGLMLLFPPYIYHGTLPFEIQQDRISVAFDLGVVDPQLNL